ncbi:MAG: TolC family protein [Bacteroidaceae bacterium]|nr:TolC family protein [Bacteroidaceae bacterium]
MKRLSIIMLAATAAVGLHAQGITLERAQAAARDNYPAVRRYGLIEQTAQFTLSNIAKGWLPQITASAQASYQSDVAALPDALTAMMRQKGQEVLGLRKDQYRLSIDVQQTVYDGGSIAARKRVASAQAAVETAQNDVEMHALRSRVDDIFFGLLLVGEKIRLCQQQQEVLLANEDQLAVLCRGGVATESDLALVRAERLTAAQQQTQLETQRTTLQQLLSLYVGETVTEAVKPDETETAGANQRPELQLFNTQTLLADARERALKSGLLPRLTLFAQGFYGYPGLNIYEDMFSHRWSLNGIVGTRLTWNIGALYTNRNDRQKLAVQRQEIDNARETFLFNNRLRTTRESNALEGYRRMMREDDEIVRLRREVRQAMESKLRHGIVNATALVEEVARENLALIARATHEVEMLKAQYELNNLNGR